MSIIFVILPITLCLAIAALAAFAWATRSGQFDDLETPALRILHDEIPPTKEPAKKTPDSASPHD